MTILLNLSTLYLYNQDKNICQQICDTLLEDAKKKKKYDSLAVAYVRIGICRDDAKLIQKGFSLLELTEETSMLSHLKKEWRPIINRRKDKKVEGFPRPFHIM